MIPKRSRGWSFKTLTAYLMSDKLELEPGQEPPEIRPGQVGQRVGFTRVLNFVGDEARDPYEAAKIMALVVRDADEIKKAAGIKAGGRKATKPPVWHTSLSWHGSEKPDEAEMMRAVGEALKAAGLGLDEGYQTYVVNHTDTDHSHVHVVVNLTHPLTGKRIDPKDDLTRLQAWAAKYEKERGQVFCVDRDAKYHGREKEGAPGERRKLTREEWAAIKTAKRIKSETTQQFADYRTRSEAGFQRRRGELVDLYGDRRMQRAAVYEKYRQALDDLWKQPGRTIDNRRSTANDNAPKLGALLSARRQTFTAREKTTIGRYLNAITAAGPGGGFGSILWLMLSDTARRNAFNWQQKVLMAEHGRNHAVKAQPRAKIVTKAQRADEIKQRRTAELAAFDAETVRMGEDLKTRHAEERAAEMQEKRAIGARADTAWKEHRARYGQPARLAFKGATRPMPAQRPAPASMTPEARRTASQAAWYQKQFLQQSAEHRLQAATAPEARPDIAKTGWTADQWERHAAEILAREAAERAERGKSTPDVAEAFHAQTSGQESTLETEKAPAEAGAEWTPEAIERYRQLTADADRHAEHESGRDPSLDPGRVLGR